MPVDCHAFTVLSMLRSLSFALAVVLAGCTGAAPPAPSEAVAETGVQPERRDPLQTVVPVVRLAAGRADTLLARDLLGTDAPVLIPPAPTRAVRGEVLRGGRLRLSATPSARGLYTLPIRVDGAPLALAVEVVGDPGLPRGSGRALRLRVLGTSQADSSWLLLTLMSVAADGTESPPDELDDEEAIIALDGNRPLDPAAVFLDPASGRLEVDLDDLAPGLRRLRLAARGTEPGDARISEWVELPVRDHRLAGSEL